MLNSGFIMLKREFLNWEWYADLNTSKLFFHCLLKVNYSEKKWQGITIKAGEFISSYEKLAVETGLTISKVRTSFNKLVETKYVVIETTGKYSKILIPRLSEFVVKTDNFSITNENRTQGDMRNDTQITIKSQSNHKRIATTNTNNKNIITRKKIFRDMVYSHSQFNSNILDSFFKYWSEFNKEKTEMRFEEHKYFEIEKRLEKWIGNEKMRFGNSKPENNLLTNR